MVQRIESALLIQGHKVQSLDGELRSLILQQSLHATTTEPTHSRACIP